MVSQVRSLGLHGVEGYEVLAECYLSGGLPNFEIVGLPDTAVKEARDRVRAAVKNCGFDFPLKRITMNLAPADKRKEGPIYDLPLLLSLLKSSEQLPCPTDDAVFLGELSLSGALRRAGLNIDWFPTNFIPWEGTLWYVDYECNDYMEQWDFPHWGRTYWSRTPELLAHAAGREREAT